MEGVTGRAARREHIAAELRQLRKSARRTVEQVAEVLDCAPSRVRHIEAGTATLRAGEAAEMLALYRVGGSRREGLLRAVRELSKRNWWYPYADMIDEDFETQLILEDEAAVIRTHQPNLVPGLLQTRRYAWELIATLGDVPLDAVERLADLRSARQRVLGGDGGLRLEVILDEAALRRSVGGAVVMREQYEHLTAAADNGIATIQVMPFQASPRQEAWSAFHVFEFAGEGPAVVQVELLDRVQFVRDPGEVGRYESAFEQASARALDVERSRAFLAGLAGGD
jgi:transcriptional regulator with XRE-family HTH domain